MPHVIVKLWPGKSEQQKMQLAGAITKDVMRIFDYGEDSVSVAMEEVSASDWEEKGLQARHRCEAGQALQEAALRLLTKST
jgi:4-oxalocrotonate tautomerase